MTPATQAESAGAKAHQAMIGGAFLRNAWYVAAWSDAGRGRAMLPSM